MTLFSTRTHGVLDYASVVLLCVLPRIFKWSLPVTRLLTGSALATLGYSLLTRYELGLLKTLPMLTHLGLDRTSGLILCAAAGRMTKESSPVRLSLLGLGLFEITASLTTAVLPAAEA